MRKAKYPVQTTISLSEYGYDQIKKRSDSLQISFGELIRELLEKGFKYEALKEGKCDDNTTDIS